MRSGRVGSNLISLRKQPEGESIPASHTDQNDIMTTEIEQGNGDNSHHDSENEQNQIPQSNNVKGKKGKEITLETLLQPFWSKNMTLEEAAIKLEVYNEAKIESSKKGKQHQNAKKRKFNDKEPCGSDSSQQNLANITVGECIMGAHQLTLPNHVLSNPGTVSNLTSDTVETIRENLMETLGDIDHHQCAHEHLDGANECTLSDALQQNESSSSNFTVKATYKDDIVRFDFSLSNSIDQLKEEVANQLELEVNTFKIKYQDEDKDWVLVTRISNLEHALNLSRSNDSNVVRLLTVPKT
ncbi:protein NLP2-like [Chenopodium quinoa]|uniref:protein NLP2-like n=1 Tax=Chenopodium quinoa TaxID=63459 RepID=UPI000B795A5D|nr:protein NLP2-like [Chenopodium quinoa]